MFSCFIRAVKAICEAMTLIINFQRPLACLSPGTDRQRAEICKLLSDQPDVINSHKTQITATMKRFPDQTAVLPTQVWSVSVQTFSAVNGHVAAQKSNSEDDKTEPHKPAVFFIKRVLCKGKQVMLFFYCYIGEQVKLLSHCGHSLSRILWLQFFHLKPTDTQLPKPPKTLYLSVASRIQRLIAAFTLQTELVPIFA